MLAYLPMLLPYLLRFLLLQRMIFPCPNVTSFQLIIVVYMLVILILSLHIFQIFYHFFPSFTLILNQAPTSLDPLWTYAMLDELGALQQIILETLSHFSQENMLFVLSGYIKLRLKHMVLLNIKKLDLLQKITHKNMILIMRIHLI